jgi:hypothetical protein
MDQDALKPKVAIKPCNDCLPKVAQNAKPSAGSLLNKHLAVIRQ